MHKLFPLLSIFVLKFGEAAETYIVGGIDARIEDHPYQAALEIKLDEGPPKFFCGGSIYSSRKIITAAHCTIGWSPEMLIIRVGSSIREKGGEVFHVQTITNHPDFDIETMENDIAILLLSSPIKFGYTMQPLSLPFPLDPNYHLFDGVNCTLTGWGKKSNDENAIAPDRLQVAIVPIVSHTDCKIAYASQSIDITENMFCSGYFQGGIGPCHGDSGGPLVKTDIFGNVRLYGIVSFGIDCASPGLAAVYTNVVKYLMFIGLPL